MSRGESRSPVMLAGKAPTDLSTLTFPVLVSPKLDGVRAIIKDGVVLSRNLKPIPNQRVQRLFGRRRFNNLDGELIVGDPTAPDVFSATSSGVMSRTGEPDVQFYIFDRVEVGKSYTARTLGMEDDAFAAFFAQCTEFRWVRQYICHEPVEIDLLEEQFLDQGYEGAMIRDPSAQYKFGRSTTREAILLKLKRFLDGEAYIEGWKEKMHNANALQRDEIGRAKRSSNKAGLIPTGVLGAWCVRDVNTGERFDVGSGITEADRKDFWEKKDKLLGEVIAYKYFPQGTKDAPRFPTFKGFRSYIDL